MQGWADTLNETLGETFTSMLSLSADMVVLGQLIGGLGALVYIAYHLAVAMARNEPFDPLTLARPFAIGIIIAIFPQFLELLNFLLGYIVKITHAISELGEDTYQSKLNEAQVAREQMQQAVASYRASQHSSGILGTLQAVGDFGDDIINSLKLWFKQGIVAFVSFIFKAASVCINVLRTFHLVILGILGPIIFGFSIWEGLKGGIQKWFTLYIQTFMWLPMCYILQALLMHIQIAILNSEIADYNATILAANAALQGSGTSEMAEALQQGSNIWPQMLFYIVGITTVLSVPTLCKYIVEAGAGVAASNRKIQQGLGGMANNRGTRAVAAAAGQRLGRAAGGGFGGSVARSFLRGGQR